jgi:hypothetical protein
VPVVTPSPPLTTSSSFIVNSRMSLCAIAKISC